MLNVVALMGRTTRDIEVKKTNTDLSVAQFSLAVNSYEKGNEVAHFFDCVVFGSRAEALAQYVKKGTLIAVQGRLTSRSFLNKNNEKVTRVEILVDNFEFTGSKASSSDSSSYSQPTVQAQMPQDENLDNNLVDPNLGIDTEDGLPF